MRRTGGAQLTKTEDAELLGEPDGARDAVVQLLRGIIQNQETASLELRMAAARALIDLKLGCSVQVIINRFGQALGSRLQGLAETGTTASPSEQGRDP